MISRQDLKELLAQQSDLTENHVLSIYLDVDQGNANNLNRGFEAALKSKLQKVEQGLDDRERKRFLDDAQKVTSFVSDYQPEGKTLVLFSDTANDLFWERSLSVHFESSAKWMARPFIRPLLEARDEFERSGFILTDRAQARLFTIFMGSIEEHHQALAESEVKKFDASPSDQMRSQMHLQRKAAEHARSHLRKVAEMMDRLAQKSKFDRLILGGPSEAVGELRNLLSDALRKKLVGTINLPIEASASDILESTVSLERKAEREAEEKLVENLFTAAAKDNQAVVGLEPTLSALRLGRIRELVYTDLSAQTGYQCQECAALFSEAQKECPNCSGDLSSNEDLLEVIVERVFEEGGSVEHVRREVAESFKNRGEGIGAFLRF